MAHHAPLHLLSQVHHLTPPSVSSSLPSTLLPSGSMNVSGFNNFAANAGERRRQSAAAAAISAAAAPERQDVTFTPFDDSAALNATPDAEEMQDAEKKEQEQGVADRKIFDFRHDALPEGMYMLSLMVTLLGHNM